MKKVILGYASESAREPGQIVKLRTDIIGNVTVLDPDAKKTPSCSTAEWLGENAARADFVVIFYIGAPVQPIGETSVGDGATDGQARAEPMPASSNECKANALQITPDQRAMLPDDPIKLVAIFRTEDRNRLPSDLKHFRCFDLSLADGQEALLCNLVHEPIKKRFGRGLREDAAAASFRLVMGVVALLLGTYSKTDEILIPTVGESVALVVHCSIGAAVLILLFTGLVALIRLALYALKAVLDIDESEALPGGPALWRRIVFSIAAVVVVIIAFLFFPRPPRVEHLVNDHLREWAQRLEGSQLENGGIREHHDQGVAQVWISSQALAGLLSSQTASTMSAADIQRAFTFIQWARIAPLDLKPGAKTELAQQLAPLVRHGDFSNLQTHFSTFALTLDMVALTAGEARLKPQVVQMIEQNKGKYFSISDSSEGWGYFEQFEWGVTEVAAWVAIAEIQSLRANQPPVWTSTQGGEIKGRVRDIIQLLSNRQIPTEGAFSPIADISNPNFARTYSTIMALWAMAEAASPDLQIYNEAERADLRIQMDRAIKWLGLTAGQSGWRVNPNNPADDQPLGLAAQTLCVLGRVPFFMDTTSEAKFVEVKRTLLHSADKWTKMHLDENARVHDSDSYLYPTDRVVEKSTMLWYPWCVGLMRSLSTDPAMTESERKTAAKWLKKLSERVSEFGDFVVSKVKSEWNYVPAEGLVAYSWPMDVRNKSTP